MFEYFCTKNLVVFVALFMVDKTCSAPGPEKVDNSVRAATATEANSDENQDAGDANWNKDCGLLKLVICVRDVHGCTHFQGRGSHNEVPSCPKSSRDCWKKSMKSTYGICLPRISGLK